MQQSSEHKTRPSNGRALAIAAALLCAIAISQPNPAYAGPHGGGGGGGFHGGGFGGFHGGGGGFHGGGFHGAGSTAGLADFMVTSRVCTMVFAVDARVSAAA